MRRLSCTGLLIVAGALAAGCAAGSAESRPDDGAPGPKVGQPMPAIAVKDFKGQEVTLASLKGKVVFVDIWASWCAPCKEELPLLDGIAARLKSKGVEFLAISIDESRDDAMAFISGVSAKWVVSFAHDPEGRVAERLKPPKMPTSYIVDRKGIVRDVNAGFSREDAAGFEARLTELAGGRASVAQDSR